MELGQDGNIAALTFPIYVHFYFVKKWRLYYMNEKFMKEALIEARKSLDLDEVPVGAIIVNNGKILARAHNLKNKNNSSLAHAEMLVIEEASRKLQNWRLNNCDIYVTLEPCPMCASAIKQSRISNIYYGAKSSNINNHKIFEMICENRDNNFSIKYFSGLKENESLILLRKFFKSKR